MDVALVCVPVGAVLGQVALVLVDVALIRITIRTIFRQVLFVLPHVFLVVLTVLLLWGRVLGVSPGNQQTGKRHREHTSTDEEFCLHFSLLIKSILGLPPYSPNQTHARNQSFAVLPRGCY